MTARRHILRSTFAHIPGIGLQTERAIWSAGVGTWEQALDYKYCSARLARRHADTLRRYIERSVAALHSRDLSFFESLDRLGEGWRVYTAFKEDALCLDIETTGLSAGDRVTVIGTYARNRFRAFVAGENLYDFAAYASHFSLIVTFNGACFDVPFISRKFPKLRLPFHLDVRYPAARCGLAGGLKAVERRLGIKRPASVRCLGGLDAIELWRKHEKDGDRSALERLLEYNENDVRNLKAVADSVCSKLAEIRCAEGGLDLRMRSAGA